ncbi:hypothetical protein [Sphaerisporangium album]|nr:hypothetical protein [Sphaerisporangium album]
MTRRDVQGYALDLVALSESQQSGKSGKDRPPALPGPVRIPPAASRPPRR